MDTGGVKIFSTSEILQIVQKSLKLSTDEEIKLLSYSVKRGSNDLVGFMGEYYKLEVLLQDKTASSGERLLPYFVKTVPISNEFHKDECERKGFFGKETRIYTEILPNVQKYAPTKLYPECYLTRPDLIVLEDLSLSTEGFRHLTSDESYSIKHHKLFLKHLAKLHAASIAWELEDNINIGEQFKDVLFEMQLTLQNEWYTTGAKGILFLAKMHPKYQTPEAQKFINEKLYRILCEAEVLTEPSKKFRNVLCHRDSWDRNIFFKYDRMDEPIDCRIVDFQLTRYSPPGIDVLFFLYVTTTTTQRDAIYNECLDYYHDSLRAALKALKIDENLISKENFLQDCKRARLAVLILWAICEPLMKMPKGLSNKMRADEPEKFDYYMNTERDELFLRVMEIDSGYKGIIMAPIEEMLDYLLHNEDLYLQI